MRRTPLWLVGLSAAAVALAACGGDDDTAEEPPSRPPAEGAGAVVVVAESISSFDQDAYDAAAGEVTIRFENPDSIPHTVVVEDEDLRLVDDGEEGSIELGAGDYTLFCDVPGHRDAGMEATLTVG